MFCTKWYSFYWCQAATKEELVHSGEKLYDSHSNYQVCPSFVFLGFSEVNHSSVELWK